MKRARIMPFGITKAYFNQNFEKIHTNSKVVETVVLFESNILNLPYPSLKIYQTSSTMRLLLLLMLLSAERIVIGG